MLRKSGLARSWPRVSILGADQKDCGLWGQERHKSLQNSGTLLRMCRTLTAVNVQIVGGGGGGGRRIHM